MENWNPLTDTVPIHSWIHPWLPLMQARLEPLYSPIRSKLSSALQKWHPSDSSAKLILQPWKEVFTPGSWEAFMVKNIVPKLGESRKEKVYIPPALKGRQTGLALKSQMLRFWQATIVWPWYKKAVVFRREDLGCG